MLNRGIASGKHPPKEEFPFGFRGGCYVGAPGKDIWKVLPKLSDEEFVELSEVFAKCFPTVPPDNHVGWAAAIRYVYGCFEKQGCLRSKEDKERIVKEQPDWKLPYDFMNEVRKRFEEKNNRYGLVLHYEMMGHRFGDLAIIENHYYRLDSMVDCYEKSHKIAVKIKSLKHIFTPYYWAACYFNEMGHNGNTIKYHTLNLKYMERYCPDARPGYREKAKTSIIHLKKMMLKSEWDETRKWLKSCRNKCLKKVQKYAK